jgi:hypothetical protein
MDERTKKKLPCKLNAAELVSKSHELAHHIEEYDRLEAHKKSVVAGITEELKELRKDITQCADEVEHERVYRLVDCMWQESKSQNEKYLVRLDTGETVDTQPLTPADLQSNLALS